MQEKLRPAPSMNGSRGFIISIYPTAQTVRIIPWEIFPPANGISHVSPGVMRDIDAVGIHGFPGTLVFILLFRSAVTTSLANPRFDFDVNALGTLNVLEALRATDEPLPLVVTSTNKVYEA